MVSSSVKIKAARKIQPGEFGFFWDENTDSNTGAGFVFQEIRSIFSSPESSSRPVNP